jgi:hypothetical protein
MDPSKPNNVQTPSDGTEQANSESPRQWKKPQLEKLSLKDAQAGIQPGPEILILLS